MARATESSQLLGKRAVLIGTESVWPSTVMRFGQSSEPVGERVDQHPALGRQVGRAGREQDVVGHDGDDQAAGLDAEVDVGPERDALRAPPQLGLGLLEGGLLAGAVGRPVALAVAVAARAVQIVGRADDLRADDGLFEHALAVLEQARRRWASRHCGRCPP